MNIEFRAPYAQTPLKKFEDPNWTAKGERRADVALKSLDTLWINTGTLCNIECVNCYIESSPTNDRLVYITASEVLKLLNEIRSLGLATKEIGITGGEPFMNPDILSILRAALERDFKVLVLTNAMQPMQRPRIKTGLLALNAEFAENLSVRVSLDHHSKSLHDSERGRETWDRTLAGLNWLAQNAFNLAIAGRSRWDENEETSRDGYAALIDDHGWPINPRDKTQLVLLPEMDGSTEVPEITTDCWNILNKSPDEMMCATSRMVVKRKGAAEPSIVPCTLLPYDTAFNMGPTISQSMAANQGMFSDGSVKLCHPHCAKFCVLGGGSCS
ncbi:MAG: radical SAM protein [Hyphomicrobiaceae bacterium]